MASPTRAPVLAPQGRPPRRWGQAPVRRCGPGAGAAGARLPGRAQRAGKSTLLKILAAQGIEADSGERAAQPAPRSSMSARSRTSPARPCWTTARPAAPSDYEAHATLADFGLDYRQEHPSACRAASVAARLWHERFAEQPDVLLLDEPTNHLDILRSRRWKRSWPVQVRGPDRQPRPRLPEPRHQAHLLAGAPQGAPPGQGLPRVRAVERAGAGRRGRRGASARTSSWSARTPGWRAASRAAGPATRGRRRGPGWTCAAQKRGHRRPTSAAA